MGCWAISKKEFLHAEQKLLKQKSCKLRGAIKNRASAFYSPGPVFDVKKIHAQTITLPKKIMHNLKVRKKTHATENCPPPLHPLRKIMARP